MARQSGARQAFTLIETLACIGVVSVLIGILLPVLRWSRGAGRDTGCLANLHSFGTSVTLYRDAHKSLLPFADRSVDVRISARAPLDDLAGFLDCDLPRVDSRGAMQVPKVFRCPADRDTAPLVGWSYQYTPADLMAMYPIRTVVGFLDRDPATVIMCDGEARHGASDQHFVLGGQNVLRIDGAAQAAKVGHAISPGL